jgi:lambda repressor-like predicted transcriptional regulator
MTMATTRLTALDLIDRELRTRGSSLDAWSTRQGLSPLVVVSAFERELSRNPEVLYELAAELGISAESLGRLFAELSTQHAV